MKVVGRAKKTQLEVDTNLNKITYSVLRVKILLYNYKIFIRCKLRITVAVHNSQWRKYTDIFGMVKELYM